MKHFLLSALLLTCVLQLSACALLRQQSAEKPQVTLAPGQRMLLPSPKALGMHLRASQLLSAAYQDKHYSSEVHIEVNAQRLVMVALGGWGGQVFSLQYDGKQIHTSHLPMPKAQLGISHVLADFMFTYAPTAVLQQRLAPTQVRLTVTPKQRLFRYHGRVIMRIDYQTHNPWQGRVVLQNKQLHYRITIDNLSKQDITREARS